MAFVKLPNPFINSIIPVPSIVPKPRSPPNKPLSNPPPPPLSEPFILSAIAVASNSRSLALALSEYFSRINPISLLTNSVRLSICEVSSIIFC